MRLRTRIDVVSRMELGGEGDAIRNPTYASYVIWVGASVSIYVFFKEYMSLSFQ